MLKLDINRDYIKIYIENLYRESIISYIEELYRSNINISL